MPNNTGEFAARVEALRQRLEAAQQRLAGVAKQQNGLLEALARNELEQQKERIGTYQIQARFALASIYDRAALGGGTVDRARGRRRRIAGRSRSRAADSRELRRRETPPVQTPPTDDRRPQNRAPRSRGAEMKRAGQTTRVPGRAVRRACVDAAAAPKKKEKTIGELRLAPGRRPARSEGGSQRRARHGQLPALPRIAEDRSAAARRSAAPPRRPQHGSGRGRAHGGRSVHHRHAGRGSHQALHEPAQELSRLSAQRPGALPARARLRNHGPARKGAGDARRRSCASIRKSPQLDEVQFRRGELLFSARDYRNAQRRLSIRRQQGRQGRVPLAEPLQTRLVAVQAGPERREPAVVRAACSTARCSQKEHRMR